MRKLFYGFLIFIAVALVSIPFIDWQNLKQPILNKVQSISGCEIEIKGPIHIQLFPTPKIVLSDALVRPTTQPIGSDSFQLVSVEVEKLRLSWSWVPLLRGKFDIHHFDLKGPVIMLKSVAAPKKKPDVQSSSTSHSPSKTSNFSLHHFAIESGKVVIDAGTPKQMRLDNIDVSGFINSLSGPAELAGAVTYNDINFNFTVNVSESKQTIPVSGSVTVVYKGQTYSPLSFSGFVNQKDKQLLKTHLTIGYEGNTLILDTSTDFEKDQTELAITSKKISYKTHQLLNLRAALKMKGSEVWFNKVEGEMFEGKLDISGHLQADKKLALQVHVHQLNLIKVPALHDSLVKRGRLETLAKLNLNLNNPDKLLETLSGTMGVNVTDGAVETIDIDALTQQIKKIKDLQSLAQGLEITKKRRILDIKTLRADFNINKGIATTKNLEIAADPVDISGQGDIDISQSLLNLILKVHVKALGKLVIPFKITGNWNAPTYGVDQEQLGAVITKNLTQTVVNTVVGQVRKKAEEMLGQGKNTQKNDADKPLKPEKIIKEVLGGLLG